MKRKIKPFSAMTTEDSLKSLRISISINGDWLFSTDSGGLGMEEKWYSENYDTSTWAVLKSGLSWQEQGISHHGYGWYRQGIFIPPEFEGAPLTITFTEIKADDDAWFNGTRIGGIQSEYKYKNLDMRAYAIPSSLIRYGEVNSIVIRIWGGNMTFIGDKSGLIEGPLVAKLDYCHPMIRDTGGEDILAELYDLSDARHGKPFELILPFPAKAAKEARIRYCLNDFYGNTIKSGDVNDVDKLDYMNLKIKKFNSDNLIAGAVIGVDNDTAQTIYLRGRFTATLYIEDESSADTVRTFDYVLDRLSFAKRDECPLPALPEKFEETPYGRLKLVDEIDASTSMLEDPHPYLQSGYDENQRFCTPGSPVEVKVSDILGKKARESEYGWFAYRIGRGRLNPRSTYLLRIEYPEDKPRYAPIEIQTGQNYMDVGWKNGVAADDVYDNWPLSNKWQWYDVIVPLDDETVGAGGTGSASAENGFWVYFMNKLKPFSYHSLYSGGPAVSRIQLYEIDPVKNAPVINRPKGLPNRVLSFDWERQPDHEPADLVCYAKLMGYSAISPVIIKWGFANYGEPLNGYISINIDDRNYWAKKPYDPESGEDAAAAIPGKKSVHARYLEATKHYGIEYIPRIEWGGSYDLPEEARAIGEDGQPARPNRFADWCSNLLHPLAFDDYKKLLDHMVKPYVKENQQFTGILWRIRCNRLPVSYGLADIELFAGETGTGIPAGTDAELAAWASGIMKVRYDDWWHQKRADFHMKLSELLKSYQPDLKLYYYNWDEDKFSLIEPDIYAWSFLIEVDESAKSGIANGGRAVYEKDRGLRKSFKAWDYINVLHTGNLVKTNKFANKAHYGLRPELYKEAEGICLFAPANYLCYADMPEYLNYFQTAEGLSVSNAVSYDEINARFINPKYEGNMITPAGASFSMALELLSYFHGDAVTLNYTVYTYGRGFADAHRRFAQAFLALPAIKGTVVEQGDEDLKVRIYSSANGTYVGVAYKGYNAKKFMIKIPGIEPGLELINLVTNQKIPTVFKDNEVQFELESGPMELNSYVFR